MSTYNVPIAEQTKYSSVRSIRMAQRREIEQYDRASLDLSLDEVGSSGSNTRTIKLSVSKPIPKRLFTPNSSLLIVEQIRLIMSGGMTEKKDNPAELGLDLAQFLRQKKSYLSTEEESLTFHRFNPRGEKIEAWRQDYNDGGKHKSHKILTPYGLLFGWQVTVFLPCHGTLNYF